MTLLFLDHLASNALLWLVLPVLVLTPQVEALIPPEGTDVTLALVLPGIDPASLIYSVVTRTWDYAVQVCVHEVNEDSQILPNTNVSVVGYETAYDGKLNDGIGLMKALNTMSQDQEPVAIIGELTSDSTKMLGYYGTAWGLPVLGPSAVSSDLTKVGNYFLRTIGNQDGLVIMSLELLLTMGWSRLLFAYHSSFKASTDSFNTAIAEIGSEDSPYNHFELIPIDYGREPEFIVNLMISTDVRIVIMAGGLGSSEDSFSRLTIDAGAHDPDWVWITLDCCRLATNELLTAEEANRYSIGLTDVIPYVPDGVPEVDALVAGAMEAVPGAIIYPRIVLFYDACRVALESLHSLYTSGAELSAFNYFQEMLAFEGFSLSGLPISFDEGGDLESFLRFYNYIGDGVWQTVYVGNAKTRELETTEFPYTFGDGSSNIPLDTAVFVPPADYEPVMGLRYALVAFAALGLILTLSGFGYMVKHRTNQWIKSSSFPSLTTMSVGLVLAFSIPFLLLVEQPTNLSCRVLPILGHLGFSLIFSSLFCKTYRLLKIFKTPQLVVNPISRAKLRAINGTLVLVTVLQLVVWMAVNPPYAVNEVLASANNTRVYSCRSDSSAHEILLILFGALYTLWGVQLAVLVRNLPGAYNESKYIATSLYTVALLSMIVIPLLLLSNAPETSTFLTNVAVLVVSLTVWSTIFGTKFYKVYCKVAFSFRVSTTIHSKPSHPHKTTDRSSKLSLPKKCGASASDGRPPPSRV